MANTFNKIWRSLSMYNADIPPRLIQDWVEEAWTKVCDAKLWSWALEEGQFETLLQVDAGTMTLTNGSATTTSSGTPFLSAQLGHQIKLGNHIFTIDVVNSSSSIDLDRTWPLSSTTTGGTVLTAYFQAPVDFYGFVSVIDVEAGRRIWTNIDMKHIDRQDPKRTGGGGIPTILADRKWKTSPSSATTVPTYEFWPHPTAKRAYRILYWKVPALFSRTVALPHTISDRILKNYARAQMSTWPGDNKNPNRMHSRISAKDFMAEFRDDMIDAMVRDDEIYDTDVWLDTKMVDLHGPIGRTEAGPFPSIHH